MPVKYSKHAVAGTPQTEQARPDQILNAAGGYAFQVDDWMRLKRFCVLGVDGPTFYASEQKLAKENAKVALKLIKSDGVKVVALIRELSLAGRTYKQDALLFVLALCLAEGDEATKHAAEAALPEVCRIGTHLFSLLGYLVGKPKLRGWGRSLKRAIAGWYLGKDANALAYQVVKYQQRDGWSHFDALRLAHPKDVSPERNAIYRYIVEKKKGKLASATIVAAPPLVQAAHLAGTGALDSRRIVELIREHNLPRECIPTEMLQKPEVWKALLVKMPLTALVRNLGTLTKLGLLAPFSEDTAAVVTKLTNAEYVHKARVHPIQMLAALKTYASGEGVRGSGTWTPVPEIVQALESGFYAAFDNVEPTGKRIFYGLDVSASMGGGSICGVPNLQPWDGVAVMAMASARKESKTLFGAFGGHFELLQINPTHSLEKVREQISSYNFGDTDSSLLLRYALEKKIPLEAAIILSDGESWSGGTHVFEALARYRRDMRLPLKLIGVDMTATKSSPIPQDDGGCLNVVGMSTDTPAIIADFIRE